MKKYKFRHDCYIEADSGRQAWIFLQRELSESDCDDLSEPYILVGTED